MAVDVTTKPSEPKRVTAFMNALKHPRKDVLEELRRIILSADDAVGEEIKWNSPTFFYTGEMRPSNPKEYRRYLVVSNLHRKDCIRLVFWRGARVNDTSGLLEGDYDDGRRLASFSSLEDVAAKKDALLAVVREQLRLLEK